MIRSETPAGTPARPAPNARRIVIVSAAVGAGHDGAARELGRRLESEGFPVERYDFLDLLPAGLGRLLSGGYRRLLDRIPDGYQRLYAATERAHRPGPAVRALLRGAERAALQTIPPDAAVVVSTYPGASQLLGALRRKGRLAIPVATYLTDFSVHPLWVAPGVDAHLAVHPVPAGQALARGATGVRVCGPAVGPRFAPSPAARRHAARLRFGLGGSAPLALVVAGSWGVGDVERAAADIKSTGIAEPVVVCGRNQALAARLRALGFPHVHGWVGDMPDLMRACDVLVQNAGGLTSLEAFASGLPVVSYRCIPGHGQANAAALDEAGLAVWIRDPAAFGPALAEVLDGPLGRSQRERGLELSRPGSDPAQVIAEMAGGFPAAHRTAPGPVGRRRFLAGAAVAMAATAALAVGAPLAEAYADSPGGLTALTRLLDEGSR